MNKIRFFNMNKNDLSYEIINYLIERINYYVGFGRKAFETLSLATRVSWDLGLDGEDASDFMEGFFEHFGVDPGDYDHYRYFKPEGTDIFVFFRSKDRRAKTVMTLGMLYNAAKMKAWNCETLEKANFSTLPIYNKTEEIPITGFSINTR
ncbi:MULTISPECIES: DUF1493 family protein [Pseudomonas syringae group]|uniref:DUF1493 family protein n=1 Tax=Pseudomonas syringae pv. apii TaxID=81036 RepID=A0A3M3M9P5_9PSED|nr:MULTISPECIES: DUF1493 family protein [Pseudomonas syringae group]RMN44134.1 Prophage PssSM-03, Orf4 [Pseudomonas syringae pv. apii]RMN56719.1 Prophage PssSM-03, Orf4 [Pseudomonas syringae pv. apii]RMN94308.1 hypothetical protein ALQ49_01231 [Pseudomonas syringae pv. apii]